MNKTKKKKLISKGWRFGGIKEFLGLTDKEVKQVEQMAKRRRNL